MWIKKIHTLVFLRTDAQILLGLKKRGFGVNKWNGFGGKVNANESIVNAAARKLKEECEVQVKTSDLKHVGHLEFTFENEPLLIDVRVFSTCIWQGTPKETEEMAPKWFNCEHIPYGAMWPDDRYWFPYMLKYQPFYGIFRYRGEDKIIDSKMYEVESMENHYAIIEEDKKN